MKISANDVTMKRLLIVMFACLSFMTLAGCEDNEVQQSQEFDEQPSYAVIKPVPHNLQQGMPEAKPVEMLSVADPTPPEQWLLTLYQAKPDADKARDTHYYQQLLSSIKPHVHEQPRVIANRTVQTTRQLLEMGIEADEDQMLEDFATQLQTISGRIVYGELCANYSNLRQQQLTHQEAIQDLFESL